MAERVLSPGVVTRETDLSQLPAAIKEIGAVVVGPTVKGQAFVPTYVSSIPEYERHFGPVVDDSYASLAAYNYLRNANGVTVVRVLGSGGYSLTAPVNIVVYSKSGSSFPVTSSVALLHPTTKILAEGATSLFETSNISSQISGSFNFTLTGSSISPGVDYSASLESVSDNQLSNIFGRAPKSDDPVYLYVNFKQEQKRIKQVVDTPGHEVKVVLEFGSSEDWNFKDDAQTGTTPWITSQKVSGDVIDLFRIHTLSHGRAANYELKVVIENIRPAGSVPGSTYGAFDVVVYTVDQSQIPDSPFSYDSENIIESFRNVNINPDSPDYIARRIGDRYFTTDSQGRVIYNGDFENQSNLIRVEVSSNVGSKAVSNSLVPFGFRSLISPLPSAFTQPPAASFKTQQVKPSGIPSRTVPLGFDYDFTNTDNINYLVPLPDQTAQTTGSNVDFLLSNYSASGDLYEYSGSIDLVNSDLDARKFAVPFQGGSDGRKPNTVINTGAEINAGNVFGFDLSSTSAAGYKSYKKALDSVSNPDEFDWNLIVLPGLLYQYHSNVINYALELVESRADAIMVIDSVGLGEGVNTAISTMEGVDSSYACTYYPWVKQISPSTQKPLWIPPSTVIPGVFSYNDALAQPWWAPAGLTRGALAHLNVIDVYTRLLKAERERLYQSRINSIIVDSQAGPVVWGQKTLQGKPSALDRVDVRRLVNTIKKFIASASRYLVFEKNTATTRQRFLNIVNPYLESVQQRQGLEGFQVIMDESNNTPDVIDRNQIVGKIKLIPTKTGEVIILDFEINPSGTVFPNA